MGAFLLENMNFVSIALALLGIIFILYRKGAKRRVFDILFYLVVLAEKEFGNGTGQLKFAAVTTWVYEKLPPMTRLLFTTKQIDKMIEQAVEKMKTYLQENKQLKL